MPGGHFAHNHHSAPQPGKSGRHGLGALQSLRRKYGSSRNAFRQFLAENGIFGSSGEDEDERTGRSAPKKAHKDETGEEADDNAADHGTAQDSRSGLFSRNKRAYILRFFGAINRRHLAVLLILSVLMNLTNACLPWSPKLFLDYLLPKKDTGLLITGVIAFACVGLLSMGLQAVHDLLARRVMGNFIAAMRRRMIKHLQQLSLDRLQELKVGGVVSRLQSDTEAMAGLLQGGVITPLNALQMMLICLGSLLFINWKVMLVCLAFCGMVVAAAYIFFRKIRPFQKALREELAGITAYCTEIFGGIRVVRAFGRERAENLAYGLGTHLLWRKNFHAMLLNIVLHRAVFSIYVLLNAAIWGVAGYYFLKGQLSMGEVMVFFFFIRWLFMPIFMIMSSFAELQRSLVCAERVFDLLDEPVVMPDAPNAKPINTLREGIEFDQVSFKYPDGTQALEQVSFAIPAGKVVALVGPSGAGKSTVSNLVMRFYDVSSGRIMLDNADIREFKLADYRSLLGLVLQDVFLFDGTIRENIAYARPHATQDEIEAAARVAHCHEFITALEDGYDTLVGEKGVKLSGGEKQRIALARAVLANAQLLILDEATSNLDSESEALIQDALRNIFKNRTTLVIAHRLSTVMDADKIVVLDHGRKVEEGAHQDLLARRGRYWELYTRQMEKAERARQVLDWSENGE